jgi:hypothetical protein
VTQNVDKVHCSLQVDNFVMCIFIGINVTWSVTLDGKRGEGGVISTMDIRNVLRRSRAGKRGKISLNQSLLYIQSSPPSPPPTLAPIILFAALKIGKKKNYFKI